MQVHVYSNLTELQSGFIKALKERSKTAPVVVLHDIVPNPSQWRTYGVYMPRFMSASQLLLRSVEGYRKGRYINETIASLFLTRLFEELLGESDHPLAVHARELRIADIILPKTLAMRAHELDKALAFAGRDLSLQAFEFPMDEEIRDRVAHFLPIIELYHRLQGRLGIYDIAQAARTFYEHIDEIARMWSRQVPYIIGLFPEDLPAYIRPWWLRYLEHGGEGVFFTLAQPGGHLQSFFRYSLHHERFSPVSLVGVGGTMPAEHRAEIVERAVKDAFLAPLRLRATPQVEGIYIHASSYWLAQVHDAVELIGALLQKGVEPHHIALIYPQASAAVEYEIEVTMREHRIPYHPLSRTRYGTLDPLSKSLLLLCAGHESIRKALPHLKSADEVEEVLAAIAYLLPQYSPVLVKRHFNAQQRQKGVIGGLAPLDDEGDRDEMPYRAIQTLIRMRRRLFRQGMPLSKRIQVLCKELLITHPWRLHERREEYFEAIHFSNVIADMETMLGGAGLSQEAVEEMIVQGFFGGIVRGPSREHVRQEVALAEKAVTVATPYAYLKRAMRHEYHIWLDMGNPQWAQYETGTPLSFYDALLPPAHVEEGVPVPLARQARLIARLSMHAKTIYALFAPYTLTGVEPETRLVEALKTIAMPLAMGAMGMSNDGQETHLKAQGYSP